MLYIFLKLNIKKPLFQIIQIIESVSPDLFKCLAYCDVFVQTYFASNILWFASDI